MYLNVEYSKWWYLLILNNLFAFPPQQRQILRFEITAEESLTTTSNPRRPVSLKVSLILLTLTPRTRKCLALAQYRDSTMSAKSQSLHHHFLLESLKLSGIILPCWNEIQPWMCLIENPVVAIIMNCKP